MIITDHNGDLALLTDGGQADADFRTIRRECAAGGPARRRDAHEADGLAGGGEVGGVFDDAAEAQVAAMVVGKIIATGRSGYLV